MRGSTSFAGGNRAHRGPPRARDTQSAEKETILRYLRAGGEKVAPCGVVGCARSARRRVSFREYNGPTHWRSTRGREGEEEVLFAPAPVVVPAAFRDGYRCHRKFLPHFLVVRHDRGRRFLGQSDKRTAAGLLSRSVGRCVGCLDSWTVGSFLCC